jgi:hypothetical protein
MATPVSDQLDVANTPVLLSLIITAPVGTALPALPIIPPANNAGGTGLTTGRPVMG